MKILRSLSRLFQLLSEHQGCWAVCGGIAATIYRDVPRHTGDIDIAIIDSESRKARDIAEEVLTQFGYVPALGFLTDTAGRLSNGPALILGRESNPDTFIGVDFLLPVNCWVPDAVRRAQSNLLDFGVARAPAITVEDLLLAKSLAVAWTPSRLVDLDDIHAILRSGLEIDRTYIRSQLERQGIIVPEDLKALIT